MVNRPDKKEQIDDDILQSRADVIRSTNRTSSSKEMPQSITQPQKAEEKNVSETSEGTSSLLAAVVKANKAETARTSRADIPRFDLAEEIMAQQRKITGIKRKAPGRKTEVRAEREDYERKDSSADYIAAGEIAADEDLLITEIVARDIERLRSGD